MCSSCRTVVILGPTAVGKSRIAIALAESLPVEIISADSRAFFKDLDIVTDKPSLAKRNKIAHHLIDIVPLMGKYDAMAFRNDVERLIPQIQSKGHVPIIVGGGTLYLGAILRGIFNGPSANPAIRKKLRNQPIEDLYARLKEIDPQSANKIHPNDQLRIVRALEVHMISGQTISKLKKEATPLPIKMITFGLKMKRQSHRQAITSRIDQMLSSGLIEEVRSLIAQGLEPKHQAYRTIGIPEAAAFLKGEITYQQLKEKLVTNTWSLARRQLAWFKHDSDITWIDVTGRSTQEVATYILSVMEGKR